LSPPRLHPEAASPEAASSSKPDSPDSRHRNGGLQLLVLQPAAGGGQGEAQQAGGGQLQAGQLQAGQDQHGIGPATSACDPSLGLPAPLPVFDQPEEVVLASLQYSHCDDLWVDRVRDENGNQLHVFLKPMLEQCTAFSLTQAMEAHEFNEAVVILLSINIQFCKVPSENLFLVLYTNIKILVYFY
jgi:hypothetical protein